MKVVITGACGYAGREIVRVFCEHGFDVLATDVAPPRPSPQASLSGDFHLDLDPRATFQLCDVRSAEQCAAAVRGAGTCIHVGALVPYNLAWSPPPAALFDVNVVGTQTLLAAAAAAGVRQFIYCSSTGVVFAGRDIAGATEAWAFPDQLNIRWNDDYSESKARAERAVLVAHDASGMATLALRPNGIWGPNEQHHIPKVLTIARLGLSSVAIGSDAYTDWTHRTDLAGAFIAAHACLTSRGSEKRASVGGRAYFVTSPWRVSTQEFFAPLLHGIGFASPFPCAIVDAGSVALRKSDGRLTETEWRAFTAEQQQQCSVGGVDAQAPPSVLEPTPSAADSTQPSTSSRRRRPSIVFAPSSLRKRGGSTLAATVSAIGPSATGIPVAPATNSQSSNSSGGNSSSAIIITGHPSWTLPSIVLFPVAAALEAGSASLRMFFGVSVEPFITCADVRKVIKHNYYDSSAATRELGWVPRVSPAEGMAECVRFYRALGYNGAVHTPALGLRIAVLGGLLTLALLAFDAGGALSALLTTIHAGLACSASAAGDWFGCEAWRRMHDAMGVTGKCNSSGGDSPVTIIASLLVLLYHASIPPVLLRAGALVDALFSLLFSTHVSLLLTLIARAVTWDPCTLHHSTTPSLAESAMTGVGNATTASLLLTSRLEPSVRVIQCALIVLCTAAVTCHALQGALAARLAWKWRSNSLGWAINSLLYGFASTSVLMGRRFGERAAAYTVAACISCFCALVPVAVLVRTLLLAAAVAS